MTPEHRAFRRLTSSGPPHPIIAALAIAAAAHSIPVMIVNELPVPWWWKEKRDPSTEITRLKRSDKPGFLVLVGERQYYLVCVERPPSYLTLVSLIKFHPVGAPTFHVDHFDLLSVEACQYFIDCILKDFDPSVYGLDAETLRSDLDYLRVEAGQWRDFWVQQSRWSASVIEE